MLVLLGYAIHRQASLKEWEMIALAAAILPMSSQPFLHQLGLRHPTTWVVSQVIHFLSPAEFDVAEFFRLGSARLAFTSNFGLLPFTTVLHPRWVASYQGEAYYTGEDRVDGRMSSVCMDVGRSVTTQILYNSMQLATYEKNLLST